MKTIKGKEVRFDWFQVSFDFITVRNSTYGYFFDKQDPLFIELIQIFKRFEEPGDLEEMKRGMYGYHKGIYIDEFIYLSYGGKKTVNDTYPMTLTMTGQGCRAFDIMDGNWLELFKFFQKNGTGYLKIGRIDIAIDDYEGNEITPYEILEFLDNNHVVTYFRKWTLEKGATLGANSETTGFTITLGARGSNQLVIYDKRLERDARLQPDLNTDIWYRYEMRFTENKAREIIDRYVSDKESNDSYSFMKFARELLFHCLDLKEYNPNDKDKNQWKTHEKWVKFLDSVEKIKFQKNPYDTTIEKKLVWYKEDMATTTMELYLVYGEDFFLQLINIVANSKFTQKHLDRFNKFLVKEGKPKMTMKQIKKLQEKLKEGELM